MENWTVLNELFEPNLIKELEKTSKQINVQAGNTILEIGEIVRHIPIILDGSVKVSRIDEDNRELLLYYVNPKESCAMTFTCCMQHNPSEIRAVAEDDVQMLAVPIEVMDKWLNKFPSWKNFVMKTIHIRFTELLKAIDQIAFQKLDERLITYLKEKSKATNSTLVNLSHQQIADELATSRVVISRLLKSLENENKLLLYRNQIKILKAL
ncbi:MAG: Crp/Fnr family transcriptional regulator [Chitinophagales bacterium]